MKKWQIVLISLIAGFVGGQCQLLIKTNPLNSRQISIHGYEQDTNLVSIGRRHEIGGEFGGITLQGANRFYRTDLSSSNQRAELYISHKGHPIGSADFEWPDGVRVTVDKGTSSIKLMNSDGDARIIMEVNEMGNPTIKMFGTDGKVVWAAPNE